MFPEKVQATVYIDINLLKILMYIWFDIDIFICPSAMSFLSILYSILIFVLFFNWRCFGVVE